MRWRDWSWTVCLVAGCNQIWGLEKTDLIMMADADGDGVTDPNDDCVDVPDPAQVDTDDDGLGDACDPCPAGANHDEDGDGLGDGCDNCPAQVNVDQANADGDDLGDACDHDAGQQTRLFFDGFDKELDAGWVQVLTPWTTISDAATPTMDINVNASLWNLQKRTAGTTWYIESALTVANVDGTYGIMGFNPTGTQDCACVLHRFNTGNWEIMAKSVVLALPAPPQGVVILRARRTPTMMHCEIEGGPDAATIDNICQGTQPGVTTSGVTIFKYIDVVNGP